MKQLFKNTAVLAILLTITVALKAQQEETAIAPVIPKWVSDKGYWVVEGNVHNKQKRIVHFYNNEDQKVYQQTIVGKFKISKRKNLMHMKRMLDTAVVAYEQKRPVSADLFATTR